MPPPGRHERRVLRKAAGLRARSRRRRKDEVREVTIDFTDPAVARRWRRRTLLAVSAGAVGGITWYALAPGVASYQIGYTLALPAFITGIVWIGKRLPRWLDWVIAVVVGAGGSVAYVLFGGSQWWLWAQVALLPFVLLVLISGYKLVNCLGGAAAGLALSWIPGVNVAAADAATAGCGLGTLVTEGLGSKPEPTPEEDLKTTKPVP